MKDQYVHGSSKKEQRRLTLMNKLINQACLRALDPGGEELVLDVGCGTGEFTRALARCLPAGAKVIAVERDPSQLATAAKLAGDDGEAGLVDFRVGEAMFLPLKNSEFGSFDLVHTRFLLEHTRDPLAVVKAMCDAVRPGGRIVLADDDHDILRLWPEPDGVMDAWRAYFYTYQKNGNDPFVGRRLVQLLHQAGAEPQKNTLVFYGGCAGMREFSGIVHNLYEVLGGAAQDVIGAGLMDEKKYIDALYSLRDFSRRPDAALWYGISWAEGRKPGFG
jgi:SAM-dependent methyltransferase